jgi:hypothetical protein
MDLDVTTTLQYFLEGHAVPTRLEGQRLLAGRMSAAAWIFRKPSASTNNLLQLDINVESPLISGRNLIESFAGWGSDEQDAIKQAWRKFSESSLHVLLEVFVGGNKGGNQIEWESWSNGPTWRVCLGPLLTVNFSDHERPNLAYGDLLDKLRDALLPKVTREYHWLRFYYMKQGSSCIGSECLLDNESWSEGENLVNQWNWPEGSYSARLFLIMVPDRS